MNAAGSHWPRLAEALDRRLRGHTLDEIAAHFGVTRQRASQMTHKAGKQLAFRVFRGVRRPLPKPPHQPERDWLIL